MLPTKYYHYIIITLIVVVLTLAGLGLWAATVYGRGQALVDRLGALEATARDLDLRRLPEFCARLGDVTTAATDLRSAAGPALPLIGQLGWAGEYSRDLAAAGPLLAAADDLGAAGELLCAEAQILLTAPEPGQSVPEAAVARIAMAAPALSEARALFERADLALGQLDPATLSPQVATRVTQVRSLLPQAIDGIDLALALPELMGAGGRRRYLVVAQNPDELRPTGGFMSAAGLLELESGRVVGLSFEDSTLVDNFANGPYPLAPDPMRRYMVNPPMAPALWVFRDANWSPDLPTSAGVMLELYQRGKGQEPDGLVVFTPAAVRLVLRALGPVAVEAQSEPVGADNLDAYIRTVWSEATEQGRGGERKESLNRLAEAMLARVLDGRELDLAALARALSDALDQGELAVYVPASPAATLLAERGWDGALAPEGGDYLHIVGANIGYNKVGPSISQRITYAVDLSNPANPRASATLTQRNSSQGEAGCAPIGVDQASRERYEDLTVGCYWSYVRVYAPGEATLLDYTVPQVPDEWMLTGDGDDGRVYSEAGEAGTSVFGALAVVPRGAEQSLTFRYQLPTSVLQREGELWRYRLRIARQPGTDQRATVQLLLPAGAELLGTSHQAQSQGGQIYAFELPLEQDAELELLFRAP